MTDGIKTPPANSNYRKGYDRVWGKRILRDYILEVLRKKGELHNRDVRLEVAKLRPTPTQSSVNQELIRLLNMELIERRIVSRYSVYWSAK